ncbi:Inosine-uridine preferring nucleoside hydrolase [Candidatus Burkholderia verschuerenii]|uniref:Inosine-uridine preferring nucleoside hydrolase n=1 Tax=Candidatus Burkholderia verschuerenii TaxID=242163 RepID=A0A0L0MJP2_9BURK|nr:nucleoside hydrolase [Candidatus Burkholderia verschuerenii]KND62224.1 Inosine-uridine preferring nucleoside hydrolase [Candidatus Burkholderia verschuerenii]
MHKVIYDTDPGIDDAIALVFQARHPHIDLLGITTVFGNADIDTTTANALYLASRFCADVPVVRGAAQPLKRPTPAPIPHIHGHDALGDIARPEAVTVREDGRAAHRFIVETVRANPGEVTLLAVGPLTNLALALQEAPEIAALVREVVVMGGAFGFNGDLDNVTPTAEANAHSDPHAADIVFGAPWKVSIVGLDVTHATIMTTAFLASVRDSAGDAGRFVWDVSRFYERFHSDDGMTRGIYAHDYSAAAFVVARELFTTRGGPVCVLTDGIAAGMTVQKPASMRAPAPDWDARPSCDACVAVDADAVLDLFARTLRA